jgi:hypothetical protein
LLLGGDRNGRLRVTPALQGLFDPLLPTGLQCTP